jgi:hypothetical protein
MTYTREHNGTESLIGSTTIHRLPLEVEFSTGLNYASQSQPLIPGIPTDFLAGRDVYDRAHDYAGTYIDTDTVLTFWETDLVITYPTPYDKWMDIGIYTETPNASIHPSSDFQTWPASVCGTYSTSTEYSYTYWTSGDASTASTFTSSSPTTTYTLLQPSDPSNYLRYDAGQAYGDGDYVMRVKRLDVQYVQAKTTQFTEARISAFLPTDFIDWLATQESVTKIYPYIKNCWLGPKGEGQPTVHVAVMALTVTSSTFLDSLETQTVEPSEKASTLSHSTKSTVHTIVTVMTSTPSPDASTTVSVESKQSSPDSARPKSTGEPRSQDEKSVSETVDHGFTPVAQPETEEQSQTPNAEDTSPTSENAAGQLSTSEIHSTTSDYIGLISNPVGPAKTTQPKSISSATGFIEGLVSAIQSAVAHQGEVSQAEPSSEDGQKTTQAEPAAVISTTASEERPAEWATGSAIGTEIASPGGEAVTRSGSVYFVLPSGSGLRVVAGDQTSTITDAVLPELAVAEHSGSKNDYVVGDNTLTAGGPAITSDGNTISALPSGSGVRIAANGETRIVPAAALTASVILRSGDSEDEYIFAGDTLSAGGNALHLAGVTYSALGSGSGIIMMAEDTTSTLRVGQAISASFASGSNLDSLSPLLLPAGSQQLGTHTASTILGASDETGNATATATGINGGTTSAQGTGTVSSTHGLGDAIISGIGGGDADDGDGDAKTSDPQSSTDVEAASHATQQSVHVLLGGFCMFAFALALL